RQTPHDNASATQTRRCPAGSVERGGRHSSLAWRPLRICGYFCLKLIDDRVEELVEFPDRYADRSARLLPEVVIVRAVGSRGQVIEPHRRLHKQGRPQMRAAGQVLF